MTPLEIPVDMLSVGRSETREQRIDAGQAVALGAALGDARVLQDGDVLPPLWHWLYFNPAVPRGLIGRDGHPRATELIPAVPLPRRMWAGGRLTMSGTIRLGDTMARHSEIVAVTPKHGRQGALVFVTLRHTLSVGGAEAIVEEQDLVYRDVPPPSVAASPGLAPAPASAADWTDRFDPDTVLLFRYSALTANTHRIHYDLPYAQAEEGYPALVVHGPLTATLLVRALGAHDGGVLRTFSFRGERPLFVDAPIALCGTRGEDGCYTLEARNAAGAVAMSARAEVVPI